MNTTSIIVKKTATKKTTKKEYLFNQDVWRIIMSYVGTPQQFIDKKITFILNGGFKLYSNPIHYWNGAPLIINPLRKSLPIVMTKKEFEFEGFNLIFKKDKYLEVFNLFKNAGYWAIQMLKMKIKRVYQNANFFTGRGMRILKVFIRRSDIQKYRLYNDDRLLGSFIMGDDEHFKFLVIVSDVKK